MEQNEQPTKGGDRVDYYRWLGFGFEFCGVVGFFCYVGYRLDVYFGTSPWLLLAGFFVGFLGMMYSTIKDLWKKSDNNKRR
jgi:F0F1-type ATP synthase assembly protein I